MAKVGGATVVLNPKGLAELLESENGAVMHEMARRAQKVKQRAIQLAPVGKGPGAGFLRSRIVTRPGKEGGKPVFFVGPVGVPYAQYVSEGTRPHYIFANQAEKLVFFWEKTGRVMYLDAVFHPGTQPNPYLTKALEAAKE